MSFDKYRFFAELSTNDLALLILYVGEVEPRLATDEDDDSHLSKVIFEHTAMFEQPNSQKILIKFSTFFLTFIFKTKPIK